MKVLIKLETIRQAGYPSHHKIWDVFRQKGTSAPKFESSWKLPVNPFGTS